MEKNLYVFRLCSFLDFNNLNIEQDNYYTHTSTKERLLDSREWFLPLKIFLINEFVPSAHCRLVTNFRSGVQGVFGVVVGDGAARDIWDISGWDIRDISSWNTWDISG